MAIKVGIGFFVTGYTVDAITLARAVEEAGFDSFWVPDHPVLPVHPETTYRSTGGAIPSLYGEMADPLVLMSYIAAATTKLRVATGVTLIPERHPLTLAKAVSTLDNFSNGRVTLGVGAGWLREEIELYGTDFRTRWRYVDESVQAMKALWRDGSASFEGEYVRFPEVRCDPLPVQKPTPPVIVGAPASERTFRRIATWGDGWLPVMPSPQQVEEGRRGIEDACKEVGRDASGMEITCFAMDVTPETQRAYEDAGADRIVLGLYNHPGTPLPFDRWAEVRQAALSGGRPPADETLRVLAQIAEQAKL
jgi:probable F420-dependent oxidoreductase